MNSTEREEDGVIYIDVNPEDEVIKDVRSNVISASKLKELIEQDRFEEIKKYIPDEAYNILYKEYRAYKDNPSGQPKQPKQQLSGDTRTQILKHIAECERNISTASNDRIKNMWKGRLNRARRRLNHL